MSGGVSYTSAGQLRIQPSARFAGLVCIGLAATLAGCGQDDEQTKTLKEINTRLRDVEAKVDELRTQPEGTGGPAAHPAIPAPNPFTPQPLPSPAPAAAAPLPPGPPGDSASISRPTLPALLLDPNPRIRRGAALLISQYADPALKEKVITVSTGHLPPEMAPSAVLALSAYCEDPKAQETLRALLAEKDYKLLRPRLEVLTEVKNPLLAPLLLECEKNLDLENLKQIDWDLVVDRRTLVDLLGQQGNPVAIPRLVELIRLQSAASPQAVNALLQFHDDKTIAPRLAALLKDAREHPPAKVQLEFTSVYNGLQVARRMPGPETLTRELVEQLFNPDNNIYSAAFYGLRDWPYEKRAELILAEVVGPDGETMAPGAKDTHRWERALRLLYETNSPDTDLAIAQSLKHPNYDLTAKALGYLRDHANPAGVGLIGEWIKRACADPAYLARDGAGQDLENAAVAIAQSNSRGSFAAVAPLFQLRDSADFAKATDADKKKTKEKLLDSALRNALQIESNNGVLSDCPLLVDIYNKLPEGDFKKSFYDTCTLVHWPLIFDADHKTVTLDQARYDQMMKDQKAIPNPDKAPDQF